MIVGEGIDSPVHRLLVEHLGLEQVGHRRGSRIIKVAVQAQVLVGLLDALLGNLELLLGFLDAVPGILHPDLQQFGIVGHLLDGLLVLHLLAAHSLRAAPPPVADGHAHRSKHHAECPVIVQQVVIVEPGAHGHRGQILPTGHLHLQPGGLDLLAQQPIFRSRGDGRCMVLLVGIGRLNRLDIIGERERRVTQPAVLRQQQFDYRDAVSQLDALALNLIRENPGMICYKKLS